MKRALLLLSLLLTAGVTLRAQYVVSDKYDLWFEDTGYEVTTRKPEFCNGYYRLNDGSWKCIRGRYISYVEP